MDKKHVYPFRIKDGAFQEMRNILRFPEGTGPEIDGQACRITVTAYSIDLSLKKEFREQYKNDNVCQVRLLGNNERDFIVMAGMMTHLAQAVITNSSN